MSDIVVSGHYESKGSNTYIGGIVGNSSSDKLARTSVDVELVGKDYIGGLLGYGEYVEVHQVVVIATISGYDRIGGVVGHGYGKFDQISATLNAIGHNYIGGIIGFVNGNTLITNTYSSVSINGNSNLGGIIGFSDYQQLTIEDSYSTGTIAGINYVGGIAGRVYLHLTFKNLYSTITNGSNQNISLFGSITGVESYENLYSLGYSSYATQASLLIIQSYMENLYDADIWSFDIVGDHNNPTLKWMNA
jgi:hypothetical protein